MFKSFRFNAGRAIEGTNYSQILIIDTDFSFHISPPPRYLEQYISKGFDAPIMGAVLFKEYLDRNISPIPNYFRFLRDASRYEGIKLEHCQALYNIIDIKNYSKYINCIKRWSNEDIK